MKSHLKKIYYFVFFFILFSLVIGMGYSTTQKTFTLNLDNPVFKYEENALNNTNTTEDLIFSGNENITRYITIPKNSTILSSNISLSGEITPSLSPTGAGIAFLSVEVGNVTADANNEIVVGTQSTGSQPSLILYNSSLNEIWNVSIGSNVNGVDIGDVKVDHSGREIAAGCQDTYIYLFNSTKNQVWSFQTQSFVNDVSIGNLSSDTGEEVIGGMNNGSVYILNSSGNVIRTFSVGSAVLGIDTGEVASDAWDEIAVGAENGNIYLFNSTSDQKWSYSVGSIIQTVAIGNVLEDSGNEVVAGANDGYVYVLNSTGDLNWSYSIGSIVYSVSIGDLTSDSGNEVAVGAQDDGVYVLNSTGSLIWSYKADDDIQGVATGDVNQNQTTDPLNETVAVSIDKYVYVLNFEYYPTNTSLDIENDGDYDWNYSDSEKLRTSVNIPNASITTAIQNYLNSCNSQNCDVPFVFHSDASGDLNITFINITYDYNASEAISYQTLSAWSRTNNTLVNETIGNETKNVSYDTNPANNIEVKYVKINDTATACAFGGESYSNATVNGDNVCNVTDYTVSSSGSLPSPDFLWDNTMDTGIAIYSNETSYTITEAGEWKKNVTIWNETTTIFYNVTANTSLIEVYSGQGLYVEWYSNGTYYDITPDSAVSNCNQNDPTYVNITINGTDDFFVCKQDTDSDGQVDFFKWKQPHTSTIIYLVNGSTNHPANLTNLSISPPSDIWGNNFTISVNVTDLDADNVTVNLWIHLVGLDVWEKMDTKNTTTDTSTVPETLQFNVTSNKTWVGVNEYLFEYRDFNASEYYYHNWANTTDTYTGPNVTKHSVSIEYISGNETDVNRTGSNTTLLVVRVNDTDNASYVGEGVNCSFWITTDGNNFILSNTTTTNATGHCNYTFDPNSSYAVGQQVWIGGAYQNPYYYDQNSSNLTLEVFGQLNINLTASVVDQNFTRGSEINLLAKLYDDNGNTVSQEGYNCTWYVSNTEKINSTTNSSGYCNYSWPTGCPGSGLDSDLGSYLINVTLWNESSISVYYYIEGNESSTNITLKDDLNVTVINPANNEIVHQFETITLNSSLSDSCGNAPSESYNISWYLTKEGTPCPSSNPIKGEGNTTWAIENTCRPYPHTLIANATGDLYNSNEDSILIYIYGWAEVDIKDPLSDDEINRSESTIGESYDIVCYVGDANRTDEATYGQNYPVNFWYSNDTIEAFIGLNQTQSSGNATYTWNISNAAIEEGFYDVKCSITDNSTLYYNASVSEDTSINVSIVGHSDIIPPEFLQVNATSALQYNNITISAKISDLYGVDKVWVNITYPNGSTTRVDYLENTSSNNKIGIWNLSLNLTDVGDYDFVLFANDTAGNKANTTDWFEVYLEVQFYGNMTDKEGNNVTVEFTFYRNGTHSVIHTNSTSSSQKEYNFTIHKRVYDLEMKAFNNTVKFLGVNISNHTSNPVRFDSIPWENIPLITGVRNRLVGFAIESTLNFTSLNITLNYTGAYKEAPTRFYEGVIDIYQCSNWNFTDYTSCSGSWVNRDGTVVTDLDVVWAELTSLSAFVAGDTATPGDGICDTGESCETESACCGGDTGVGAATGGDGGGGGGREEKAVCPNGICEAGENVYNCPEDCGSPETLFSLWTNLTNVQLNPGDQKTYALKISNNVKYGINASVSVTGTITDFIDLEKTEIPVETGTDEDIQIYVSIPKGTDPGTYTGDIVVTGDGKTISHPVTITISLKGATYLELEVQALNKVVGVNETGNFRVRLFDVGYWKKFNVSLIYRIKDVKTEEIFYEENESRYIEATQSFIKKILMSDINIPVGHYYFDVEAEYDGKTTSAFDDFEVTKAFWTSQRITQITLIVTITSSIIAILYGRKRYIEWKIGKARYIFPIDFGKLPKGKIWLGKIAETHRKAYFKMNELKTHVLTAGATGSGKTVSAMIFVEELLREKIPVIVFDPTAQWTGFVRPCKDPNLLKYYKEFGMRREDTRPYNGMIYEITDPNVKIDFKKYMNPGEITVFTLNKLKPGQYDIAVRSIIDTIFAQGWEESTKLRMVVVFDEVHRLLEKYGGKGGYISLEKACREFRKWGIGLIMASQVLSDFKEAIKGNVLTEVQLHTKSLGDLARVEKKYGLDYAKRVTKLEVGVGMMQNPRYNEGRPFFVAFRPTLHEPHKISDKEMETYKEYAAMLAEIESKIEAMEKAGKDVFDLRTEFKLAQDKLKKGRFRMAKIYIDSLKKHLNIG